MIQEKSLSSKTRNTKIMNNRIPKIWKYYFFFGVVLVIIHNIRFLNFYFNNAVPIYQGTIDYEFYSNFSLLTRIFSLFACIALIKFRKKYPVFFTTIIWLMAFLLLSHEYNLMLFLPIAFFTSFSFISLIFYKVNNQKS